MIAVGKMDKGGIESYLMELYRYLVDKGIHVDFVVHRPDVGCYEEEIISNGSKVFKLPRLSRHPLKYFIQLRNVMRQGKYDIVHRHATASVMWVDLAIAKWAGIKTRIAHSHSSNWKHTFIHKVFRPLLNYYVTDRFACSNAAGEWMFGKSGFQVMNNGIDDVKFRFDEKVRNDYRKELGLTEKYVVINVARLSSEKNQQWLLDLAKQDKNDDVCYLIVGDGALRGELEEKRKNLQLEEKVLFLGAREDISALLSASDLFVLPSEFEGMPVTLVEAQCSGLRCVASSNVPQDGNFGMVEFLDLDYSLWLDKIKCYKKDAEEIDRNNAYELIIANNYSNKSTVKVMEDYYRKCIQ